MSQMYEDQLVADSVLPPSFPAHAQPRDDWLLRVDVAGWDDAPTKSWRGKSTRRLSLPVHRVLPGRKGVAKTGEAKKKRRR